MNLICQNASISELKKLSSYGRHSLLIEGPAGCGKSYLAKQYASYLNISDFQIVDPNVQSIKSAIEECYRLETPIVLCIENLDKGVPAASYALLKFLEEPSSNVYIVVTCRNINNVPDTIISRSAVVTVSPPIDKDIESFALNRDSDKFNELKSNLLWKCVRTFNDVDYVLTMTPQQLDYFEHLKSLCSFKDSVSTIMWQLGHYSDNSETPLELVIRYISELCNNQFIRLTGIKCIAELSNSRIASHAVLAKFAFDCKYCE